MKALRSIALVSSVFAVGCAGNDSPEPGPAEPVGEVGGPDSPETVQPSEPERQDNDLPDTPMREEVAPLPEQEWTFIDDLTPAEQDIILLKREAIDLGLNLGKVTFAEELNHVFSSNAIELVYRASAETGVDYVPPAPQAVCPFLITREEAEARTTDCRSLTDRAKVASYGQMGQIIRQFPLDAHFDAQRGENEFWYEQGTMTGIDNETILAVRQLREVGLCDRGLSEVQSAFENGVEQGRQLYIQSVNARLAERGQNMTYPDNIRTIEICTADAAFLAPARSRALDVRNDFIAENPLCPDWSATNPDEAARLTEANARYDAGVQQGIRTEHSLATERIFRVVNCNVGDPLVLDLDGDGIDIKPVHEGPKFDLFGWGEPVQTAWVGPTEGLLAIDSNADGQINSGKELFINMVNDSGFNELDSGFDNLARYDRSDRGGNGDGVIDASDAVFGSLKVWRDANQNGKTDAGELMTITEAGVRSIPVQYKDLGNAGWPQPHRAQFNREANSALATGATTGAISDAWFTYGKARQ